MKGDLKRIEQLKKEIDLKLEQKSIDEIEFYNQTGYSVNENGQVVGLSLNEKALSHIPEIIAEFRKLSVLSLEATQISNIDLIRHLPYLRTLRLSRNGLTAIDPLREAVNLTVLSLYDNQLMDIEPLKDLLNLRELYLHNNSLEDIATLQNLASLEELYLNGNRLTNIAALEKLTKLRELHLHNNKLDDISSLGGLKALQYLTLGDNNITDITHLQPLTALKELNLENNNIEKVSPLHKMYPLTHLYLNNNRIEDIEPLQGLKQLQILDLRHNHIVKLPVSLLELNLEINVARDHRWSEWMSLYGNPLESPHIQIIKKGKGLLATYFKSLEGGQKKPLNEVRVLLVGGGGSGKTSLAKRLKGDGFNEHEPQTHGINIDPWTPPHKEVPISVNLWDFGGQEVMYSTHQFFLSKNSLYVLVLDGRQDDKPEKWLKQIESFSNHSPVLVVINKIDQNPLYDLNRKYLMEKFPDIKGFARISCRTKEGLDAFIKTLKENLGEVELLEMTWGESWFNVKEKLRNLGTPYISYSRYREICLEEKILSETDQDSLLEILNALGVILCFDDFRLEDTYVLDPRWVTEGVYRIINAKELHETGGVLHLPRLKKILDRETDTSYNIPPDKRLFFIDLMDKFELCLRIDEENVLFPDRLPVEECTFEFQYEGALRFFIDYDFLPRGVFPRFMVRTHKYINGENRWRTGVLLYSKEYESEAIVKVDESESRIHITVNGKQKVVFFTVLLHQLREINNKYHEISFSEKVPMPDSDNLDVSVSYKHLLWLKDKKIDTYIPDGAEKEYKVKMLLGLVDENTYTQLIAEVKKTYLELTQGKLTPQNRGFALEKLLYYLMRISGLEADASFKIDGEQIDGSFQMGNDTFLVEAKWTEKGTDISHLYSFGGKVTSKPRWTRGLFVSINGFSEGALTAFMKGNQPPLVGMDGNDLEMVLNGQVTLQKALRLKMQHAGNTNEFFKPLNELLKKT